MRPRTRLVVEDGKLKNVRYHLRERSTSAPKGDRAPFSSLSISEGRFSVAVEGVQIDTGPIDLDVFAERGPSFEIALQADQSRVTRRRIDQTLLVPTSGKEVHDDDVVCRLEARARIKPDTFDIRRLSLLAKLDDVRAAAARGRTLEYGIRLHVIVRETEEEAWAAAGDLVKHLDEDVIAAAQAKFAAMDSVGQRRMAELHKGRFNKDDIRSGLEISPNLWAGVGLVRGGAGTALVGNPQQVADRLQEYAALGLEYFVLSGYPHLEEAYRFAELVFPLLPLALREKLSAPKLTGPFGEIVANSYVPGPAKLAAAS